MVVTDDYLENAENYKWILTPNGNFIDIEVWDGESPSSFGWTIPKSIVERMWILVAKEEMGVTYVEGVESLAELPEDTIIKVRHPGNRVFQRKNGNWLSMSMSEIVWTDVSLGDTSLMFEVLWRPEARG